MPIRSSPSAHGVTGSQAAPPRLHTVQTAWRANTVDDKISTNRLGVWVLLMTENSLQANLGNE
jgi:hypothetical protein